MQTKDTYWEALQSGPIGNAEIDQQQSADPIIEDLKRRHFQLGTKGRYRKLETKSRKRGATS